MQQFTEWDLNAALHIFFGHHKEYMLVFQDADLHNYTDRYLIPMTMAKSSSKRKLASSLQKHEEVDTSVLIHSNSGLTLF